VNPAPLFPALLFIAAPATAMESWGVPDLGERDKQEHAAAGAVVGAVTDATVRLLAPRAPRWERVLVGVAASAAVGTAKELLDARHPRDHDADPKDALATVAGGTVGVLAIELVWRF
jgi:hypothetical protein